MPFCRADILVCRERLVDKNVCPTRRRYCVSLGVVKVVVNWLVEPAGMTVVGSKIAVGDKTAAG
jgi:hypothetical protein